MPKGERLYRALVILVTGAIAAATTALIAAIALITRKKQGRYAASKRPGVTSGIGAAAKPGNVSVRPAVVGPVTNSGSMPKGISAATAQ